MVESICPIKQDYSVGMLTISASQCTCATPGVNHYLPLSQSLPTFVDDEIEFYQALEILSVPVSSVINLYRATDFQPSVGQASQIEELVVMLLDMTTTDRLANFRLVSLRS